ncbi:MAG: hypothetical protein ACREH4_14335 [Vitreimonas sp.]
MIGLGTSFACEDPDNIHGIIYEAIPVDTSPSAIVLDVEFEAAAIERWQGGPIEARVRRVVQGDFEGGRVRIGLINSSCLYPFIFGTEGLIIGHMREGFEVFSAEGRAYPSGERVTSEWRLGFEGIWFQPIGQSVLERRERQ